MMCGSVSSSFSRGSDVNGSQSDTREMYGGLRCQQLDVSFSHNTNSILKQHKVAITALNR